MYENGYHVCQVRDCGESYLNAAVMLAHLSAQHGHTTAPASSSVPNQVDVLSDDYEPYFLPPESEDELDVPVLEVLQATTHSEGDNENAIEKLKCNMCGERFKVRILVVSLGILYPSHVAKLEPGNYLAASTPKLVQ